MSAICVPDVSIDYDSSFEVVEEDTFEKIEDLDETKSDSFQFISARDHSICEVNIDTNDYNKKEDSIPIMTAIIGKWKPISSSNLENYFKVQKLSQLSELAWQHGIVCYEMKGGVLQVHTELLNKTLSASTFQLGSRVEKDNSSIISQLENNYLNTVCTKKSNGAELWKVDRFIKNGKLVIVNKHGDIECKRTYERVV